MSGAVAFPDSRQGTPAKILGKRLFSEAQAVRKDCTGARVPAETVFIM